MWINADISNISQNSTIILANNRQVLAFSRTWGRQNDNCPLPNAVSWQQYLRQTWQALDPNTTKRLISNKLGRALIQRSMQKLGQLKVDSQLLNEVVKNNDYCSAHLIDYAQLSQSNINISKAFAAWMEDYQQRKQQNNLLDINDLPALISQHSDKLDKPYIYGFKTLTPTQELLLGKIGYQTLDFTATTADNDKLTFANTDDEVLQATLWAKGLHEQQADRQIAVVCPNLNANHQQIKSIFAQVFDNELVETGQKSYNISLGLALTDYPLIRHLLAVLQLCGQLQKNRISTETFNSVITSPYISGAQNERAPRCLLVNRVLSWAQTHFSLAKLQKHLEATKQASALIETIATQKTPAKQSLEQWLNLFDDYLEAFGFAGSRSLSSTEFQLFNKYQLERYELNQLAQLDEKISESAALFELQSWLAQVIFQAQSGKNQIQVLGSLEAEGLVFDDAWVLGMSADFLPNALNMPRFIPSDIAQNHQIPHSNFALIETDSINTLNNLNSLAQKVIFSYAKTHFASEQQSSPMLKFDTDAIKFEHQFTHHKLQSLTNERAAALVDKQIKSGVAVLKNQMACEFKGFAMRLKIQSFDEPHIGLSRMEQGSIVHSALQYLYEQISTKEALLALNDADLEALIEQKIAQALHYYPSSGFKKNEQQRVAKIIHNFMQIDRQREDFLVLTTEEKIDADIGGLQFEVKLDRLDEMGNGDRIIFDYKTGNSSKNDWCGAIIKEPQLPIYAINKAAQGVAFIQLNADKISIKGLAKNQDSLPKQRPHKECLQWDEQIELWHKLLQTASVDFQAGCAAVAPNKGACDYCDFDSLCRVNK
ncbi:MAG: hypothetical protein FXV79_00145 [Candidatus Thioglobus sp.]|nr:MAG: hypothetical protein FXV79_00145 [Candidatus Thioglobus sp.]